jgi:peptide deformylase
MKRKVIQMGDKRLNAKNKNVVLPINSKIKILIKDLKDTMLKSGLIGIASPQIGENYNLFITNPRTTKNRPNKNMSDEFRIFINPKIISKSKNNVVMYEGCGSVASGKIFGPVSRPETITIEAFNMLGQKFRLICNGILSRVIQHEYDHLLGIEFTEKVTDYKKLIDVEHYLKNRKKLTNGEKLIISKKDYKVL